jgi:hypothetical protein
VKSILEQLVARFTQQLVRQFVPRKAKVVQMQLSRAPIVRRYGFSESLADADYASEFARRVLGGFQEPSERTCALVASLKAIPGVATVYIHANKSGGSILTLGLVHPSYDWERIDPEVIRIVAEFLEWSTTPPMRLIGALNRASRLLGMLKKRIDLYVERLEQTIELYEVDTDDRSIIRRLRGCRSSAVNKPHRARVS